MSAAVSVSSLQKLVAAGQITPEQIASKVKAGEIELHDDRQPTVALNEAPPTDPDLGRFSSTAAIGRGFVKGAQETGTNVMKFVKGAATGDFGPFDDPNVKPEIDKGLERHGFAEKTGAFAERVAEFAAGEGEVKAAFKAAPFLARATGVVAKLRDAAAGATAGGVITKAQGGSDTEAGINAVIGGGLAPLLEATGAGLKILGEKFQANHIRGGLTDEAAGFGIQTLNKYGLSGFSLKGTLDAVHGKITELADNLRSITKSAPGSIDLGDVLAKTEGDLMSRASRLKNAGDTANIKSALDRFTNEAADIGGATTIDEAQTLKRAVGLKGAWSYGKSDADTAMETVANVYQKYLKEAIEQSTPPGEVAALNKQLGELMPIERAIVRRLPVEARSAPLSLTDAMLLATGHPVTAAAHIATKTMAGATATYAAGRGIKALAKPATKAAQAAVSNWSE